MRPDGSVLLSGGLLIALVAGLWAATEGRYQHIDETAAGIHYVTRVDRLDPENACMILRPADVTPTLKPLTCAP